MVSARASHCVWTEFVARFTVVGECAEIKMGPQFVMGKFDFGSPPQISGQQPLGNIAAGVKCSQQFAHALVRTLASSGVPTWLNEGLAVVMESDDRAWAEERVEQYGRAIPLERIVTSFGRLSGGEAELAYASSAVAVRRMLDEAGGYAIANLLRDLGSGVEFETAFARRMNRSFAAFVRH